jgi:ankyrin repeat protein
VVARLLAAGADVHAVDDWALRLAAQNGHDAVVARLLAAGADVHAYDDQALRLAAMHGHDVVVARLLAAGADVHAEDDFALRMAAIHGHDAVVVRLLAAGGANVHAQALRAATRKRVREDLIDAMTRELTVEEVEALLARKRQAIADAARG